MFARLKRIAVKLAVLAGVPVIGALLLSAHITREAGERVRSSASIGSVEDLAELSARMADTIAELQSERALAALATGIQAADTSALAQQEAKTDKVVGVMDDFLAKRDLSRLPKRLGRDLGRAREQLKNLGEQRRKLSQPDASIDQVLSFYGRTNHELISASAALTQLSNDGELLRALSTLVATMEVKERASREHAVLNHTFAHGSFAPGLYRYFVTLVTEEGVYIESLRSLATEEQTRLFERGLRGPAADRAAKMRTTALETTEDDFGIGAQDWFQTQSQKIAGLRTVERELARHARDVAKHKVAATRSAVAYSRYLVFAVVAVSLLLTWLIGRSISGSVARLATVASRVQRDKDFSLRAEKSSDDELGALTDVFNDMLAGIQVRDRELEAHRENLEALVDERTRELKKRTEDMRLVLDTVDQGLVSLQKDGVMSDERSRAFDGFFGAPASGKSYYEHVAGEDQGLAVKLRLDWEQLADGFLPVELALDQATSRIERDGMHYALSYKPTMEGEDLHGALLMVSNITGEMAARKAEALQREQVKTIEHVLKDRAGFRLFFAEASKLIDGIRADDFLSPADKLRAVHTLKGNAGLFDVFSVAEAAHALEQSLIDGDAEPTLAATLQTAWAAFAKRIAPVAGDIADRFEVTRAELDELHRAAKPYPRVDALIQRIEHEPIRAQLVRAEEQLLRLAERLGKGELECSVSADTSRLPGGRFTPFWSAFAHVVRNVADHALYRADELAQLGRTKNRVEFKAQQVDGNVLVEVIDSGRGIDWNRVRERAGGLRLPIQSRSDLVAALFSPGLSTAEVVSDTSGRGVGLSAVAEACRALGGSYGVESELGVGTRMVFTLPLSNTELGNQALAGLADAVGIPPAA
jgi:two-component system chemotaxis sensor kinase CheA